MLFKALEQFSYVVLVFSIIAKMTFESFSFLFFFNCMFVSFFVKHSTLTFTVTQTFSENVKP